MNCRICVDCFLVVMPCRRTSAGNLGFGDRDPVLHQHRRDVHIGADLERHGQLVGAVVGAGRRHVDHAFDAVDFLFDRRGHRFSDRPRVATRIDGRDLTVGGAIWGNLAIGRAERHDAGDHDHDRNHRGEDRSIDKESRHQVVALARIHSTSEGLESPPSVDAQPRDPDDENPRNSAWSLDFKLLVHRELTSKPGTCRCRPVDDDAQSRGSVRFRSPPSR